MRRAILILSLAALACRLSLIIPQPAGHTTWARWDDTGFHRAGRTTGLVIEPVYRLTTP